MPSPTCRPLRWCARRQLPISNRPPAVLAQWLDDEGSLTARLLRLSQGQFRVEVLRQTIALPQRDEWQALGMKRPSRTLIREVILLGADEPWIFARSLLPLSSLVGNLRHLRKQGNQPLGAFLFSQTQLQRSPITVTRLGGHHGYLPNHLIGAERLWARRSVFSLQNRPLLVSEVFLPALCRQLQAEPVIHTNESTSKQHHL